MVLNKEVEQMYSEAVDIRRALHQIPEPGFLEIKTSDYICRYLEDLNISYKKYAKTGIVAEINMNKKETIAFRADMDALSMTEQNDVGFKSLHEGYMHGCGHDGHMTMLLLFAKYVKANEGDLKKNVVFIFQPAEEGPGGAAVMIQEGLFRDYKIDEIFGIHLHPEFDESVIAISEGPVMAMTGEFDITVKGKTTHGAMPHTGTDAIIIASVMIQQFQSIISRNVNPTEAAVLTVGTIHGGERRNIIAGSATLEGTIRAFNENEFYKILDRMRQIMKGLEIAYDCEIEADLRVDYPPVVNHRSSVENFKISNQDMNLVEFPPQMIAEDFSYYLKEVKGAFVFLGVKNIEKQYVFPLHNSKFNFDEKALLYGVQSYINMVYKCKE
ncbi:MAG: amidohydrolase [Clostridia bacterium]|nr:amidohydrolase [Clostridia bacterium]